MLMEERESHLMVGGDYQERGLKGLLACFGGLISR